MLNVGVLTFKSSYVFFMSCYFKMESETLLSLVNFGQNYS